MEVDGYLVDGTWAVDIRTPWDNLAEPELRAPRRRARRLMTKPTS